MIKDEKNRSYNGGGDAMPLKIWSDFSSIQYPLNAPHMRYLTHMRCVVEYTLVEIYYVENFNFRGRVYLI